MSQILAQVECEWTRSEPLGRDRVKRDVDEGNGAGDVGSWGGSEFPGLVRTVSHQMRTFAYGQEKEGRNYRKSFSLWCWTKARKCGIYEVREAARDC